MFWNKKVEKVEKVKCEECRHWIDKIDAQEIKYCPVIYCLELTFSSEFIKKNLKFYCPIHAKKYSSQIGASFYKELEVNENGEPVGYKKIR